MSHHRRPGMRLCLMTGIAVAVAAVNGHAADSVPVTPSPALHIAEPVPADLQGDWYRLSDEVPIQVGERLPAQLAAGTYQAVDGPLVVVRRGDDAAAWAEALVGMPVVASPDANTRALLAEARHAVDPYALPILVWRSVDGEAWPWVDRADALGGLAALCQRLNPTRAGFAYDAEQRAYVDANGRAIRLGGPSVPGSTQLLPGDLVAASGPDDVVGTLVMVVSDLGQRGLLDPEDLIVTAQTVGGLPAEAVHLLALGRALGPQPVHCFRRDPAKLAGFISRQATPAYKPDHPIWGLPRWRQYAVLVGLALMVVTLIRLGRRYKRRQRGG